MLSDIIFQKYIIHNLFYNYAYGRETDPHARLIAYKNNVFYM